MNVILIQNKASQLVRLREVSRSDIFASKYDPHLEHADETFLRNIPVIVPLSDIVPTGAVGAATGSRIPQPCTVPTTVETERVLCRSISSENCILQA